MAQLLAQLSTFPCLPTALSRHQTAADIRSRTCSYTGICTCMHGMRPMWPHVATHTSALTSVPNPWHLQRHTYQPASKPPGGHGSSARSNSPTANPPSPAEKHTGTAISRYHHTG